MTGSKWRRRVMEVLTSWPYRALARVLRPIRRLGFRGAAAAATRRVASIVWRTDRLVLFELHPSELQPVGPVLAPHERVEITSHDVLRVAQEAGVRSLPERLRQELAADLPTRRLHRLYVNGTLAAWGFSAAPGGSWPLTEVRSTLLLDRDEACLTAFETLPAFRGHRLYPALLTAILRERFGGGSPRAYIWCLRENAASYSGIRRVGFREIARYTQRRRLLWSGLRVERPESDASGAERSTGIDAADRVSGTR